jgi:predicted nucleotidyltransferase
VHEIREVLEGEPRIAYALLFGSAARGTSHASSDVDVAVGLRAGTSLTPPEIGGLVADFERAAGRRVDLILLDEAPPSLAYRIFRDGILLFERDHRAFTERKARAILDYLDFRPFEAIAVRGALAAARRGR